MRSVWATFMVARRALTDLAILDILHEIMLIFVPGQFKTGCNNINIISVSCIPLFIKT